MHFDEDIFAPSTSLTSLMTMLQIQSGSSHLTGSQLINFEKGDGLIIPARQARQLLESSMHNFTIRLFTSKKEIFGRVLGYDAPDRKIIMPRWMIDEFDLDVGKYINLDSLVLPQIKKIRFGIPKNVVDPKTILEFELKHHFAMYVGKKIRIKIFDKIIIVNVEEIMVEDEKNSIGKISESGCLYKNNIGTDVEFDVSFVE